MLNATSMELDQSSSASSVRITKRKLEDAIRTLDATVVSPSKSASATEKPAPPKRPHLSRSIYSSFAKFGSTSKEQSGFLSDIPALDISESAPHLAAILARSASQSKQTSCNHTPAPPLHPASEYRPSSSESFLFRLSTYKITTYANKPPQIDAVAAARCGWINDGKDRLVCGMCDTSWVLATREGMNKDAANALVEKQRVSLVNAHKDGCPWKTRQCEPSIYRVPLLPPAAMVRRLRAMAASLESILANVAIKHPLTPSQLSSLRSIFDAEAERRVPVQGSVINVDGTTKSVVASDTAIIAALFGWAPAPIETQSELHRTSSHFFRTGSYGPSASRPPTPPLSRATSISSHLHEPAITPTPFASSRMSISQFNLSPDRMKVSARMKDLRPDSPMGLTGSRDASLVYCDLCHRRIGLWGYSRTEAALPAQQISPASHERRREFDLVKEHRSYCPYIVRSSVVPSFLHSPPVDSDGNLIEGWRAVLTIVQRFELSQRQHLSRFLPSDDLDMSSTELKGVEAMVTGVKTNGGRELLRYVKGLLG